MTFLDPNRYFGAPRPCPKARLVDTPQGPVNERCALPYGHTPPCCGLSAPSPCEAFPCPPPEPPAPPVDLELERDWLLYCSALALFLQVFQPQRRVVRVEVTRSKPDDKKPIYNVLIHDRRDPKYPYPALFVTSLGSDESDRAAARKVLERTGDAACQINKTRLTSGVAYGELHEAALRALTLALRAQADTLGLLLEP